MKTRNFKKLKTIFSIVTVLVLTLSFAIATDAQAVTEGFALSISPTTEKIVLNPGDHYSSSIKIYETHEYTQDVEYKISVTGFFVNEDYGTIFEECQLDYCKMADWIKINSPTEGRLSPGEAVRVEFTIDVPENAAGGGQYASIVAQIDSAEDESNIEDTGDASNNENGIGSSIKEKKRIAYTIYAEIAGDVTRQGEIIDVNITPFLLSGNIKGFSAIKNTGNVHGDATYKLQVFPLFSDEEIYTNEEKPVTATILPDRTRYNETAWEQTPSIGIFNVVYTVEFEGVTAQVTKLVIKCPVWLLFIILFVIIALIMWIIMRVRANKKIKAKEQQ